MGNNVFEIISNRVKRRVGAEPEFKVFIAKDRLVFVLCIEGQPHYIYFYSENANKNMMFLLNSCGCDFLKWKELMLKTRKSGEYVPINDSGIPENILSQIQNVFIECMSMGDVSMRVFSPDKGKFIDILDKNETHAVLTLLNEIEAL